jgi:D-alanine-D-alanine ligase
LLASNGGDALSDEGDCLLPITPSSTHTEKKTVLDVIFPVLHGPYGEDGTIQGLLEMLHIPYVGSGVLGSALGMDKVYMKRLFIAAGLPVAKHVNFSRKTWFGERKKIEERILRRIGIPCFIKPASLGSSVGISKVHNFNELVAAVNLAAQFDRKILAEQAIYGRELEISILGNDEPIASIVGEILPSREFYDYQAKYEDSNSQTIVPAQISEAISEQIAAIATKSFLILECRGLARVDFFLEHRTNRVILNEINTMPGFTPISMYQKLWEASGITGRELVDRLVQLAFEGKALSRRKASRVL